MRTQFWFFLLLVTALDSMAQRDTVRVSDFGLHANMFTDASAIVSKAIAACNKSGTILLFDKGRYDFWPQNAVKKEFFASNTSAESEVPDKTKTFGLLFENMNGITIEGNDAFLVFHGKMSTWAFVKCSNMELRNFSIDFERPSMSELTIREISDREIVADINDDSKFTIIDNRLEWYGEGWGTTHFHAILTNPATGINTYSTWEPFQKSMAQLTGRYRVKFSGDFSGFKAIPGDVLTIRETYRDQMGGFINLSSNISIKNLDMHYMHGFGMLGQFSENIYFDSIRVAPRPESGRTMSGFADAMHFSGCKGEIRIENSYFKGLHDDPINVHGTHLKVIELVSPQKLRVKFMHPQSYGFPAFFKSDSVGFVHSESLEVYGGGKIISANLVSPYEMLVEVDAPAKNVAVGDCLENITWNAALTVKNCRFESASTRGLLVTTRKKVVVEGNTFYRMGMSAILISNDASGWYESGPVEDVEICNNNFEECGYNSAPDNYLISILPETHKLAKGYYVHRNIRITGNNFKTYDRPILSARSTDGLVFTGNTINSSTLMPQGSNAVSFKIVNCRNVLIQKNKFNTPWKPVVQADKMSTNIRSEIKAYTVK